MNVTGSVGSYNNTATGVNSNEGGAGSNSNTASLSIVTPVCFAPPSGLIDWWPGENNGTDIAGGNTLTAQNGRDVRGGRSWPGLQLRELRECSYRPYFQNASPTGLPVGNSARTVDLWFNSGTNLSSSTEAALIEYGAQSSENTFGLIFSGNAPGKLYFYGNFDDLAGATTIQPNTWYHAAVTYDGTTVVLYLNGAVEATKTTTSLNTVLDGNGLTLGLRPGSSSWNGQIDEIEIFNQALSQPQIQSIYQAGSKGKCKANATITKSFTPASIPSGGTSTLDFTITNPASTEINLTGIQFSDPLPSGVTVASPLTTTNTCGGTFAPHVGDGTVSLSDGSVGVGPGSQCTLSVYVTSSTPGTVSNTTGPISSNEAGSGSPSNTVTLTVVAPPSIAKVFNPNTIALNATTSLNFTITNPTGNPVALAGVGFTDNLPSGLTVASSTASVCGGTLTTTAPTSIVLSGATVVVGTPCTFSVTVTGAVSGPYTNTTGNVTSTTPPPTGTTGNQATANLTVGTPPSISKAFGAASIPLNGTTSLTFTLTNPAGNTSCLRNDCSTRLVTPLPARWGGCP